MTKEKKFKARVRARAKKTGESYSKARQQLDDGNEPGTPAPGHPFYVAGLDAGLRHEGDPTNLVIGYQSRHPDTGFVIVKMLTTETHGFGPVIEQLKAFNVNALRADSELVKQTLLHALPDLKINITQNTPTLTDNAQPEADSPHELLGMPQGVQDAAARMIMQAKEPVAPWTTTVEQRPYFGPGLTMTLDQVEEQDARLNGVNGVHVPYLYPEPTPHHLHGTLPVWDADQGKELNELASLWWDGHGKTLDNPPAAVRLAFTTLPLWNVSILKDDDQDDR